MGYCAVLLPSKLKQSQHVQFDALVCYRLNNSFVQAKCQVLICNKTIHCSNSVRLPIVCSVQLPTHNEEYHKELEVAQKRVKLLAYLGVTNLVEVLSRRMTYSVFGRSGH